MNNSTYTIRVPRKWWERFIEEAIISDSHHPTKCEQRDGQRCDDIDLHLIAEIVQQTPVRNLSNSIIFECRREQVSCLRKQAKWYAYQWNLEADECDAEYRRAFRAAARQSKAFALELKTILQDQAGT